MRVSLERVLPCRRTTTRRTATPGRRDGEASFEAHEV
jgi:hypothetical protein